MQHSAQLICNIVHSWCNGCHSQIAMRFLEHSSSAWLRLGFNSLGAYASVNHLHFHGAYHCRRMQPAACIPFTAHGGQSFRCGLQRVRDRSWLQPLHAAFMRHYTSDETWHAVWDETRVACGEMLSGFVVARPLPLELGALVRRTAHIHVVEGHAAVALCFVFDTQRKTVDSYTATVLYCAVGR